MALNDALHFTLVVIAAVRRHGTWVQHMGHSMTGSSPETRASQQFQM